MASLQLLNYINGDLRVKRCPKHCNALWILHQVDRPLILMRNIKISSKDERCVTIPMEQFSQDNRIDLAKVIDAVGRYFSYCMEDDFMFFNQAEGGDYRCHLKIYLPNNLPLRLENDLSWWDMMKVTVVVCLSGVMLSRTNKKFCCMLSVSPVVVGEEDPDSILAFRDMEQQTDDCSFLSKAVQTDDVLALSSSSSSSIREQSEEEVDDLASDHSTDEQPAKRVCVDVKQQRNVDIDEEEEVGDEEVQVDDEEEQVDEEEEQVDDEAEQIDDEQEEVVDDEEEEDVVNDINRELVEQLWSSCSSLYSEQADVVEEAVLGELVAERVQDEQIIKIEDDDEEVKDEEILEAKIAHPAKEACYVWRKNQDTQIEYYRCSHGFVCPTCNKHEKDWPQFMSRHKDASAFAKKKMKYCEDALSK